MLGVNRVIQSDCGSDVVPEHVVGVLLFQGEARTRRTHRPWAPAGAAPRAKPSPPNSKAPRRAHDPGISALAPPRAAL